MLLLTLNIAIIAIFTLAYVPQLKTTATTKSTDGVSPFFWALVSLSTSYSLYNVIATGNAEWYVYVGQIINAGIAALLFAWITGLRYRLVPTLVIVTVYAVINFAVHQAVSLETSQSIATAAIILAYVDQLAHFIRKRNAEGTNPKLYFMFAQGLALLTVVMAITDVSIHVIITEVVNITLLLICGILSHRLQKGTI